MRQVVIHEGRRTHDDKVIEEGALYVDDPIIPVRDNEGTLIGLADEFERNDDGEVSFNIDMTNGEVILRDKLPILVINPIAEFERRDRVTVVQGGRIREVRYV